MAFVPLTRVSSTDGLASVIVASLEDAGFHPELDCDPRGWMHFYGWPRGSIGLLTVWIPEQELAEADAFLKAPPELEAQSSPVAPSGFWEILSTPGRRYVYGGWLAGELVGFAALFAPLVALYLAFRRGHQE